MAAATQQELKMAKLKQMLEIGKTLKGAEKISKGMIADLMLDLELLYSAQGKPDKAFEVSKQAFEFNPDSDRIAFNHAWHLIRQGKLLEGYKGLNRGRKAGVYAKPDINTDKPIYSGQDLKDKTVLFQCECGLGDEIIMVRFAKEIVKRGGKLIIACSKSLIPLFNQLGKVVDKEFSGQQEFDYWIPSMNAIDILGIEKVTGEPYLKADPEYVKKWSKIIKSDKVRIGIRWAGNTCYEEELWRTLDPLDLIKTVSTNKTEIYSLQRDDGMIDLPDHVTDLSQHLETWDDTAGAMENLDLIVSSCTSIPHMSAALGRPTWVIVPTLAYYIWAGHETKTDWYDSVKIFKQRKFQDWSEPLARVKDAIRCLN